MVKGMNMKFPILTALLSVLLVFYGCEPENPARTQPNIKVRATLNHMGEVLHLGDTMTVEVQLPDTLSGTCYMGEAKSTVITSLQDAWFGLDMYRVDTLNKKVYFIEGSKLTAWYSASQKGPVSDCILVVPHLQTDTRPFNTKIYIVPQVKGHYYLQVAAQAGNCTANKNFHFGLVVGFNAPDDHLYLIAPYLGGQQFYDAIYHAQVEGFGFYAFRVE
jgi:hypothetical protein